LRGAGGLLERVHDGEGPPEHERHVVEGMWCCRWRWQMQKVATMDNELYSLLYVTMSRCLAVAANLRT
jgi:hypothetical protein